MLTQKPTELFNALQARLNQNAQLGNRRLYIGASEIGTCLRHAIASKLTPEPFDLASMGRMLAGRALENEVVQILRIAMDGRLRETGRAQREYIHPSLPLHAHSDGRIVGDEFDGVLEVKTASASTFKRYASEGLPSHYVDQVQTQMGLSGLRYALVVLVSRENLSELESLPVTFDPARFQAMESRAAKAALYLSGQMGLPDGEPDRGFCFNCPFAHECPQHKAMVRQGANGELPETTRLQLECQMEELSIVEHDLEPLQERCSELRGQIKDTLICFRANRVVLENGLLQMISSSRTSLDGKAVQRELPEVYSRFLKTSTFTNLRITTKGAPVCLSTAS